MYITGFAESISDLLSLRSIWAVRGISVAVHLALLGINLAGVKWIIRLQLLLLFLLAVSTLDFVVGSFTHLDPEHGFIGYSPELLQNNTLPDYSPGESFFTVFGVFFPVATGIVIWILSHSRIRGINAWFLKLSIINGLHMLLGCLSDFRDGLSFD